jgi:hypothetical protein
MSAPPLVEFAFSRSSYRCVGQAGIEEVHYQSSRFFLRMRLKTTLWKTISIFSVSPACRAFMGRLKTGDTRLYHRAIGRQVSGVIEGGA